MADWLAASGSLTAQLSTLGRFQVELLYQGPARCLPDEARALGCRLPQRVIVRHVRLRVDGVAVVLARSVIQRRELRDSWRLVRALGARPLGAALWSNARIRREVPLFAWLPAHHPLLRQGGHEQPLPARRARYWLRGKPLLLTEAFLPAVATLCHQPSPSHGL